MGMDIFAAKEMLYLPRPGNLVVRNFIRDVVMKMFFCQDPDGSQAFGHFSRSGIHGWVVSYVVLTRPRILQEDIEELKSWADSLPYDKDGEAWLYISPT